MWQKIIGRSLLFETDGYKISWLNQQNVQEAISVGVTKILLKKDFPHEKIEEIVPMIMEQTKANYADIGFQ